MKTTSIFAFLMVLLFASCTTDKPQTTETVDPITLLYDGSLKPFYHGVASGDPLQDRVIIWTRVTPDDSISNISVKWEVATDNAFQSILKTDSLSASAAHDYTVKVDVDGLRPDQYYYYRFHALGKTSTVGRTKTAPATKKDSLHFAIVSCANWEFGYFNAYDRIAEKEVDAVLHLGDFIYEYATGVYGDTTIGRTNLPKHECVSLQDYRTRYAQYHLDKGLQHIGERHPFIAIWDDHEVANNVYTGGAQNHQSDEGDFEQRKAAAKQAYYEWLPIRQGDKHYRSFSFGSLADVLMLDERLEGRTAPADSVTAVGFKSAERSMLGSEQLHWFEDHLQESKASWKIIGSGVVFADLNFDGLYRKDMPKNLDAWDGYPAEKNQIENFIVGNKIKDIVFVSGDTHASWAIEVPFTKASKSIAVELGTTSVSSGNGDEGNPIDSVISKEERLIKLNPHVKYLNNRDHGYLFLTLYSHKAKAEWFYVNTLRKIDSGESLGKKFEVRKGEHILK